MPGTYNKFLTPGKHIECSLSHDLVPDYVPDLVLDVVPDQIPPVLINASLGSHLYYKVKSYLLQVKK